MIRETQYQRHATRGFLSCLLTLVLCFATSAEVLAQRPTGPQVWYTRQPEIRIPFSREPGNQFKQAQLCVSTDLGRDWQPILSANPDAKFFPPYLLPADGTYWFGVRTLDFQDRPNPRTLGELTPLLKITLDRQPPTISLRQIADSRQNIVTVEWNVQDENFDARHFTLEYRVAGSDWQRQPEADGKQTGTQSWQLEPGVRLEVRARATDRAGNRAEQSLPVGLTANGQPLDPPPGASPSQGGSPATGGQAGVFYSKNMKISIGYKFDHRPISGIQVFDLWYTTDKGQHWTKAPQTGDGSTGAGGSLPTTPSGTGGAEATVGKLIFTATTQGMYGFIPVARNGVGIGDSDPRPGDPPKYWVMVDTDAPKVVLKVQPGQGYDVKNVRIEWSAEDPNLADRPVTIEYAEVRADGAPPGDADWKAIPQDNLTGRLDRAGVQVWSVSRNGPYKFLVRLKAEDKAGNVGVQQWQDPIVVDLERPSVNITGIEPAGPH